MSQPIYIAKFIPAASGSPIEMETSANGVPQATKILEQRYGPSEAWMLHSSLKR